jgi:hypothetical protein
MYSECIRRYDIVFCAIFCKFFLDTYLTPEQRHPVYLLDSFRTIYPQRLLVSLCLFTQSRTFDRTTVVVFTRSPLLTYHAGSKTIGKRLKYL